MATTISNAPRRPISTSPRLAAATEIKRLGVIGAGQMVSLCTPHVVVIVELIHQAKGLGIALVAAQKAQIPVTLVDNSQASLDKGLKFAGSLPSRCLDSMY